MNTFKNGVHPNDNKHLSKDSIIGELPAPERVSISTAQHIGAPAVPVVAVGDTVKMGQLIARADGFVSANIFSSVSGKVLKIDSANDVSGNRNTYITIENDFLDTMESLPKLRDPDAKAIIDRVRDAGIVGMGGAGFPTHVKLVPPKDKKVDTLVINGAECEPYITCDYKLMLQYTEQVLKGSMLIATALGVDNVIIAVEANKPDAVTALNHFIDKLKLDKIKVVELEVKYPQGAEKQLIYASTGRVVPQGGLPFDAGCIVNNIHTAFSIYLAVTDGQPLYKRVMTVSGQGIKNPSNIFVRGGTSFEFVIEHCGGEVVDVVNGEEVARTVKLIDGGPMMGRAASSDSFFTTKLSSSLLLLTKEETDLSEPSNCINCAKCSKACPMSLMPMYIDAYTIAHKYEGAKRYGAMDCIECGSCSFVCPAKRPLVQSIKLAKKKIKQKNI